MGRLWIRKRDLETLLEEIGDRAMIRLQWYPSRLPLKARLDAFLRLFQ